MKKLLSVLLIAGGLVAASSAVTMAVEDLSWNPTLTVVPATGEPGFEFTATVTDCAPDRELINGEPYTMDNGLAFALGAVEFSVTTTDGTLIGMPVEVDCLDPLREASAELIAPDEVGTYIAQAVVTVFSRELTPLDIKASDLPDCGEMVPENGLALDAEQLPSSRSCLLTAQITVTAPTTTTTSTTTTTTTTTTIAPTTTTAATTTTVVDDSGAAVPTTTTVTDAPVVTLPATGPGDSGVAWMALLLLVAGAALTVGARSRRENTSA